MREEPCKFKGSRFVVSSSKFQKKFINSAANKDEDSNGGPVASTQHLITTCWDHATPSKRFTFIESPGFDDTKQPPSDFDILVKTMELMKG